jgi:pimeloyl-ACP methyl ester carboxylesterase
MGRPGRWTAFQATVAGLDHSVVAPWIERVKAPALVVVGDKDSDWSNPIEEAEWVAGNFQDRTMAVAEGAEHAPMLERPESVGKAVLEFLGRVRDKERF